MNTTNNRKKWSVVMLVASVILMILHFPLPISGYAAGYMLGNLIPQLVSWIVILGAIAYLVSKLFCVDKNKGVFIFTVLFFAAALFQFLTDLVIGFLSYG